MRYLKPFLCSILCILFVVPAAFAVQCDAVVVDEAGLFGDHLAEVQAAASRLEAQGATVRVRTLSSVPYEDLGPWASEMEGACESWSTQWGGTRQDLIILAFETDKGLAAIYYGDRWASTLGSGVSESIVQETLARYVSDTRDDLEDYEGFVATLDEVTRVVSTQAGGGEPTDLSWLGKLVGGLAGIALVIFLFYLGNAALKRRRREREELAEALVNARGDKASSLSALATLQGRFLRMKEWLGALGDSTADEDLVPLREKMGLVGDACASASRKVEELQETPGSDPDSPKLTLPQARRIAETYHTMLEGLNAAAKDADRFDSLARELSEKAAALPAAMTLAESFLGTAQEAIEAVQSQGYRTDALATALQVVRERFGAAGEAQNARRIGLAASIATEVQEQAGKVRDDANGLPARRQAILDAAEGLRERIESDEEEAREASDALANITSLYAESVAAAVADNDDEVAERLEQAKAAVVAAIEATSMNVQDWEGAEDRLQDADAWLDQAELLVEEVFELERRAADAAEHLAADIEAAATSIEAARNFIEQHDPEVAEEREVELATATALLEQGRAEAHREKGDPIKARKQVLEADTAADRILRQSKEEYEEVVRQRELAALKVTQADSSILAAQQYIGAHEGDVDEDAKALLAQAVTLVASARSADTLGRRIDLAGDADTKADEALESAKGDVSAAKRRRAQRSSSTTSGSTNWGMPSASYRPTAPSISRPSAGRGGSTFSIGGGSRGGTSSIMGGSRSGGSMRLGGGSRGGSSVRIGRR